MFAPSPNCMAAASAAAKKGLVNESDVLAAFDRLDQYRKRLEASGQTVGQAARIERYAADLAERTRIAAAAKKRQAALAMIVRARNDAQIAEWRAAGMSPARTLEALWMGASGRFAGVGKGRVSVWARKEANRAELQGGLFNEIQSQRPHLMKMAFDKGFDEAVFTEMWELRKGGSPGSTGNADAQWLAKAFLKYAELARTRANGYGATIGKLDGWSGVQTHDVGKMVKLGKDAWIGYVTDRLDLERTFPDAPTPAEAARILGDIYDTIITGTPRKSDAPKMSDGGYKSPANLADSLGKHRVLHFKDAKAALDYRDTFGFGNTVAGMFGHLGRMAHVLGVMEGMGPNPGALFDSMVDRMRQAVRDDPNMSPASKARFSKMLTTQSGILQSAFDIGTGLHNVMGGHETMADIAASIRTLQRLGKLGGAFLTALPSDTMVSAIARQFRGSHFLPSVMSQIGQMLKGRPRGEQAEISYLMSTAWDGWVGHVMRGRLALDAEPGKLAQMEDLFFRMSGLTGQTDLQRAIHGRVLAAEMGMHATRAWGDVNPKFRHWLEMQGVTEQKWEIMRLAPMRNVDGKPYMTPEIMLALPDDAVEPLVADRIAQARQTLRVDEAKSSTVRAQREAKFAERRARLLDDARRELQHDVLRASIDEQSTAVVNPDDATAKWTTWGGQKRGTFAGELARMVMQFKATPIAFVQRPLARALFGQRKEAGLIERSAHIVSFAAGLMIAGYMSIVMKDTMKGYWPPRNPVDPRTILAALLQSGAAGILGDFVFANTNRFGGGLLDTAAGPAISSAFATWGSVLDARDYAISGGENKFSGAQAFNNIYGWTPFVNLWWAAPVLQYLFVNSVREAISPGYLKRQAKDRLRQYGQASFNPLGPTLVGGAPR